MVKHYIILAHKESEQLKRLIERLDDSKSEFYIHIDLKADIQLFKKAIDKVNVHFIAERVDCIWGDYTQVLATLNLLKCVLKEQNQGRIILLSGQDYPIKKNQDINRYLEARSDFEFITYVLNPVSRDPNTYLQRIKKFKFNLSRNRGDYLLLPPVFHLTREDLIEIVKLLLQGKLNPFKLFPIFTTVRKAGFDHHYKGTQWWCLNFATADKIYSYYSENKMHLDKYYKYTFCADEQFFHTILKEITKTHPDIKIMPNLHYIDWNRKDTPLPVTFQKEDLNLLVNQEEHKLFARKFDYSIDKEILDLIDENLA